MPRSPFIAVARATVAWRRVVARRPWIHWVLVAVLAAASAAQVAGRIERVDAARDAWGTTRPLLVATRTAAPGDTIEVEVVDVPLALAPDAAVDPSSTAGLVARRHVSAGEIVGRADVAGSGELALVPAGWLAVPVVESPPSGAAAGERVRLVSDGVVVAADAVIAAHHDDVTLVAVPADVAPAVPAAAASGGLVVLRAP